MRIDGTDMSRCLSRSRNQALGGALRRVLSTRPGMTDCVCLVRPLKAGDDLPERRSFELVRLFRRRLRIFCIALELRQHAMRSEGLPVRVNPLCRTGARSMVPHDRPGGCCHPRENGRLGRASWRRDRATRC